MALPPSECNVVDNTVGPWAGDCRGGFDFTLLFEEIFFSILPAGCLLIVTIFRLFYLFKRKTKVVWSLLLPSKLIAYGVYEIITLFLVVNYANPNITKTKASLPAIVLTLITYLLVPILSYAEHIKTLRPSLIINIYMIVSLLFDGVRARTLWLRYNDKISGDFTAGVVVKLIIILLEAVDKRQILRGEFRHAPPEETSGIYNRSFFWWLNKLFLLGWSKTLKSNDLFSLDKHLGSEYLQHRLQSSWLELKSRHSLFYMTLNLMKWPLLSAVIPRLSLSALNFCQPFLLQRAINLSQQPITRESTNRGYGLIGSYFFVYLGIAITTGQFQHLTYRVITMVRGGLISMLYSKTMDLSIHAADPSSSMILMSADIERITTGWQTVHELWANVIEVGVAIYLLERQLGAACAIPIAVAIISMAGSLAATSLVVSRQAMWLEAIERRISATSAMLNAMKGVKMCGLTDVLSKSLHELRLDELRISKKFRKLLIWNLGFTYIAPVAAPVLTFAVFSTIARNHGGHEALDTSRVFTSMSLFVLLSDPLQSLILTMATFMSSVGSFRRIQDFLEREVRIDKRIKPDPDQVFNHLDDDYNKHDSSTNADVDHEKSPVATLRGKTHHVFDQNVITVVDGVFAYDELKPLLSEINLTIPQSKLTMVVGPVGCGKSILLKSLLGEIPTLSGSIYLSSAEVAFCDQTPFHMNGTVQQSIIGPYQLDEDWYRTVVQVCALDADLLQLSKGDQTSIGSKGISLSGGQSQRVSLARAIYARKDIIILDDSFSGLDSETENRIFHGLLGRHGLLKKQNTTVLMSSSSCKRLPHADHIIVLNSGGKIAQQGTFDALNSRSGYIQSLSLPPPEWTFNSGNESASVTKQKFDYAGMLESDQTDEDDLSRRTGDVSIYLFYIKAVGWVPTLIFMVSICSFVFCLSFPTIWVKWWAAFNESAPNQKLGYYLGIYAMLGVLALVSLVISCWQLIITMVPKSGENFHLVLLNTVLSAPMSFFSSTDTGVTTNRFSQDLMLIDMELPLSALNTFATFVLCIAQMVLIGVSSYYAAISFPIILLALYLIQKFYLRTSRQLRLLDLETKSPLYSQFMECLNGLTTIRAFGWENALEEKNRQILDESQKPFYLLFAIQRWLTLVLDLIVAAVAVLLIVLVVTLRGIISPGFVGVGLLNVILFSQSIKLLMTFWTNLETHIGSIARIKSFTATTISENLPTETNMPPPSWPSRGAIQYKNMSAQYRLNEPVLKDVSLSIEAGQKVAVCGRTGSGKTSLILSIFRMIEMSEGSILIDGLDISTIPREEIRSRIVGVPQDSYLLPGNVRMNADPHQIVSDEAIIEALKTVQLWDNIKAKGGLDVDIDAIFLSHGQKQLFCLVRAILRPSTILILDEATSSVDSKTDQLMQRIIRERFSNHTIVAVAHKLDTILDFDKVVLLDGGVLLEFDTPHELLADPSSAFYKLYYSSHAEEENSDDQSSFLQ